MSALTLLGVRRILDGGIPPTLCSVSADGIPHVNLLSHVEYVDTNHVALTFQFFNQSRKNILATRRASLMVEDPRSGGGLGLQLRYVRTETEGPVFERLRAKLAGIAAHSGMEDVFRLRGADIYAVLDIAPLHPGAPLATLQPRCDLAAGARAVSARLAECGELAQLPQVALDGLRQDLAVRHAILWLLDGDRQTLYALASMGYPQQGIGAELPLAEAGLVGVAVREGVALRIGHMARMYRYGRTLHQIAVDKHWTGGQPIALPGLATPCSQLAVPLRARGRTVGALLVESESDQFFGYDDEDALAVLGAQLAQTLVALQRAELDAAPPMPTQHRAVPPGHAFAKGDPGAGRNTEPALHLRYFPRDGTIFIDDQYLIKGVAGAILWKIANDAQRTGRWDFSTRQLRLAGRSLGLPDIQDNLGVRLLLLQRRLADWGGPLQIGKVRRGCYTLTAARALRLESADDAAA
ncbi:GAF domain-containing protein [Achromobacter mucicolens]|uniref:GAF domain-containing protein n=1 Tax=Achromobacter mucicolens TaxID=1389922 RepID=A0ABD4YTS8_9BURK|nr:GAF domain-containing protein [Achromobacter mucicolens]MCU6616626.1 GAF domain-containing protein [Achromobacter mucicolens]MDH1178867.1 GAF domain-containing protein [Achromobacter mucicolens]